MQKKPPVKPKVASPITPQVHAPVASVPQTTNVTEANKIWAEIKDVPLQLFGLPNQFVSQFCTPVPVEPNRLFVVIKNSATLPALETALAGKYTVELVDKFVIVARVVHAHVPPVKK